jgi:hypothetical protein
LFVLQESVLSFQIRVFLPGGTGAGQMNCQYLAAYTAWQDIVERIKMFYNDK